MSEDMLYIVRILIFFVVAIAAILLCRYFFFQKRMKGLDDEELEEDAENFAEENTSQHGEFGNTADFGEEIIKNNESDEAASPKKVKKRTIAAEVINIFDPVTGMPKSAVGKSDSIGVVQEVERSNLPGVPEDSNSRIYLAGGCFWGVEKYLSQFDGILETCVGYANGTRANPTYEEVCTGTTGHAETVGVVYDPSIISLSEILTKFYSIIDPTSINRQGNDVGTQYRTGIFYETDWDEQIIENSIEMLGQEYDEPLAIDVTPLSRFFPAEEEHQKYLDKNPDGYCHIDESKFHEN